MVRPLRCGHMRTSSSPSPRSRRSPPPSTVAHAEPGLGHRERPPSDCHSVDLRTGHPDGRRQRRLLHRGWWRGDRRARLAERLAARQLHGRRGRRAVRDRQRQHHAGARRCGCDDPAACNGVLCAFAGADVGFQHTQFSGDVGSVVLRQRRLRRATQSTRAAAARSAWRAPVSTSAARTCAGARASRCRPPAMASTVSTSRSRSRTGSSEWWILGATRRGER